MREAFLSGNTDATETTTPAEQAGPIYLFESVTLTEEGRLKLVGNRYFGEGSDEFTITRSRAPHPDLLKELRRLTLHMALLTESVSDVLLYPPGLYNDTLLPAEVAARAALRDAVESGEVFIHPLLEPFRCLSVNWKSKGIVLSGERKSRYRLGRNLVLKTPETLLLSYDEEDLEDDDYPFFEQLRNTLASLTAEAIAYMGGKYGEGGEQLELFGKDAPAPTLAEAFDVMDEALHADQLRRDAREKDGKLFTGPGSLGRIQQLVDKSSSFTSIEFSAGKTGEAPQVLGKIEKRKANRTAVKGGEQDAF
jgi:hypothetical protein